MTAVPGTLRREVLPLCIPRQRKLFFPKTPHQKISGYMRNFDILRLLTNEKVGSNICHILRLPLFTTAVAKQLNPRKAISVAHETVLVWRQETHISTTADCQHQFEIVGKHR